MDALAKARDLSVAMDAALDRYGARLLERWLWTCTYCGEYHAHAPTCPVGHMQAYVVELDPGCLDGPRAPFDAGGAESADDWDDEDLD